MIKRKPRTHEGHSTSLSEGSDCTVQTASTKRRSRVTLHITASVVGQINATMTSQPSNYDRGMYLPPSADNVNGCWTTHSWNTDHHSAYVKLLFKDLLLNLVFI
jgi:hypothetical protein